MAWQDNVSWIYCQSSRCRRLSHYLQGQLKKSQPCRIVSDFSTILVSSLPTNVQKLWLSFFQFLHQFHYHLRNHGFTLKIILFEFSNSPKAVVYNTWPPAHLLHYLTTLPIINQEVDQFSIAAMVIYGAATCRPQTHRYRQSLDSLHCHQLTSPQSKTKIYVNVTKGG